MIPLLLNGLRFESINLSLFNDAKIIYLYSQRFPMTKAVVNAMTALSQVRDDSTLFICLTVCNLCY